MKFNPKSRFEDCENVKDLDCFDFLKKGGSINIKKENKGKFTETKKKTGKTTEELTNSKNPVTKKRAIFAQNAKKLKRADGGKMLPEVTITAKRPKLFNNASVYEGYIKGKKYSGTTDELAKKLGDNWKSLADNDGQFEVTDAKYVDKLKKEVVPHMEMIDRLKKYKSN